MASALCAYCGATLTPNSAYCFACGQLIPQHPVQVAVTVPETPGVVDGPREQTVAAAAAGIPIPGSLPWQGGTAAPDEIDDDDTPAPVAALESVELATSTGVTVRVSGKVVIGRQPQDTALALGARAITVEDAGRSVSRVHLFLDVLDGVISVADAGSANGSVLQRGSSVVRLESGGAPVAVELGDVVWIGDVSVLLRP